MILLEGPAGAETLKKYLIFPIKKESAKSYTLKNRNGFRVSWILRKNLFKNAGEDLVYIFSIIIKIETLSDLLFA